MRAVFPATIPLGPAPRPTPGAGRPPLAAPARRRPTPAPVRRPLPAVERRVRFAPLSARAGRESLGDALRHGVAWIAVSVAAHAALVLPALRPYVPVADETVDVRELMFLAPLLPREALGAGDGAGSGTGLAPLPFYGFGAGLPGGGGAPVAAGPEPSAGRSRPADAAATGAPDEAGLDAGSLGTDTYSAVDVDREVERSPDAGGPAYPEPLRATNVEGHVDAQFVVDTTGQIDPATFAVLGSTHPLFAEAVREALPAMRYVPAQRSGRMVRQLAQQRFIFRIDGPTPPPPVAGDTGAAAPAVPVEGAGAP